MQNTNYKILPSILSANFLKLGQEITDIIDAGADILHVDVMDNHYVPNLTFGPFICDTIRDAFPNLPIDVHLMVNPTDDLIVQFAKAKINRISIHNDATIHLNRSLQLIKSYNIQAGLALNPATDPNVIEWCKEYLDFVLVMTVNPGFGGQNLIRGVISKIQYIKAKYPDLPICVDGGVNVDNIKSIANAGAQEFIAGSAIFKSGNYKDTINQMRKQLTT